MPTQVKDGQQPTATETTNEQTRAVADPTTQDLMIQLVRLGQDISLRSLQVWADLARQLGPTGLGSPTAATTVSLVYQLLDKLLGAQRKVVDELVATQRQFAQRCLDSTVDDLGSR